MKRAIHLAWLMLPMLAAAQDTLPPNDHVPPPPPQAPSTMPGMTMDDGDIRSMLLFDRLEYGVGTDNSHVAAWEAEGWLGGDIDRLWLKTEGESEESGIADGRVEVLWDHAATAFWDTQLGMRQDIGLGPKRSWLAAGVQGLAPYWLETQATFYVGEQGRTALRWEASHDVLFTQRWILSPRVEVNVYGKSDPQQGVVSGLSDAQASLRLRYEVTRKFAPYVGVSWQRRFGASSWAPLRPDLHPRETTVLVGTRLWF